MRILQCLSLVLLLLTSFWAAVGTLHAQRTSTATEQQLQTPVSTTIPTGIPVFAPLSTIAGTASTITVSGTLAYVGLNDQLTIVDVSDPTLPQIQSNYALRGSRPATATSIQVMNNRAYVTSTYLPTLCCLAGTLEILDVELPTQPQSLGYFSGPGFSDVAVVNQHAYVTTAHRLNEPYKLSIVDVTVPSAPQLLSTYGTQIGSAAIAISDTVGYLADLSTGITVLDVSDPLSPTLLTTLATPGVAYDLQVVGDHAYVADGEAGLLILDLSNPQAPTILGSVDTPGTALRLAVVGDWVYVADGTQGIQIIDVSDPRTPRHYAQDDTVGTANDVAVVGNVLYIADGAAGLQLVRFFVATQQVFLPMIHQ